MLTPPFDQRKNQHPMRDDILSLPLRTGNLHYHSAEDGVSDHESSDFELTDDESSDGRSSVEAEVDSEESIDGGSDEDSDEEDDDAMDCIDEGDYGEPMDVDP
ncbi:hypothetical protein IEO21_07650 [Rhodonia placenta]|uniref:Uncharacterized protein n=1 Tax=Rhodonia placenta TaxID=104341 RepID=A0A8H7NY03_9APHY|nr:hypothetical protein IEO21_07650 [Postia placenta]